MGRVLPTESVVPGYAPGVLEGWTCNAAMRQLLSEVAESPRNSECEMPSWLRELLDAGAVDRDGALLLRGADDVHSARALPDQFPDLTGYEAFINHFHLDKCDDTLTDLRLAVAAAGELRRRLQDFPNAALVRLVLSRTLDGELIDSTVRFYRVRPGEIWLTDDLEDYATEAVGYLDVSA